MPLISRTSPPAPLGLGLGLRGWLRLGLAGCAAALLALNWNLRRAPSEAPPPEAGGGLEVVALDALPDAGGPSLVNDGWYVRNMATAHDAFVIEVEAEDPEQTAEIARALVEPIQDDYAEILVYVNRIGDDSDLPARRVQWTPADGYVELRYDEADAGP